MNNSQNNFDLEERTFQFAKNVALYTKNYRRQFLIPNIQSRLLDYLLLLVLIIEKQMKHLAKKILA